MRIFKNLEKFFKKQVATLFYIKASSTKYKLVFIKLLNLIQLLRYSNFLKHFQYNFLWSIFLKNKNN